MGFRHALMGIFDTARISVPTVFDAALGRVTAERCDERLSWWARKILRDAGVKLVIQNREHAGDGSEPLIVMSNHQSLHDIPVIYCSIPGRVRMVAKKELFDVPVWGRAMHTAGFICIDRGDRGQAIESLRIGGELLKHGTRVWIAPEGTRSSDGELGPFKSGGFRMALETGCRILPVAINGTRNILRTKSLFIHTDQHVTVTITPPIDARAYGIERRKELVDDVRGAIAKALE